MTLSLGTEDNHRPIYISGLMKPELWTKMEELLRDFKYCFAWDYTEMPGLSRDLVEHRLPSMEGFKPFKQPPCRMSVKVELHVKKEIVRLIKAKFIWPSRAAKHEILSFMDGHSDYNQIFIPEEDVHKTAFRCPDSIGTFEYVVMPFSVKNVGAAY
ncbi:unnamed protein product [Prunus armeniaca]